MKEKIKTIHIKILKILVFIITLLILWFLLALVYVFIFGKEGAGIFEFIIIGGGGFYSIILANKISVRIVDYFSETK